MDGSGFLNSDCGSDHDFTIMRSGVLIKNITVDSSFSLPSDHDCLFCLINSPVTKTIDNANTDFNSLRDSLNANPLFVPLNTSVDMALEDQSVTAINYFVPNHEIKASRCAPWISCDIMYTIKKKKTFWRKEVRG